MQALKNAPYDMKNAISKNRLVGLWRLITGYQMRYSIATLSLGFAALSKTATYLLLKNFVDQYFIDKNPLISLPLIAGSFVLLAVFQGGFSFLAGALAASTTESSIKRLRDYLFDHLQRLHFSYHDKTQTGELIQRVTSDVDALRRFYQNQAIDFGRIVLLFVVNFVALLTLNVKLALISVAIVPVIMFISMKFFKRISDAYESYQEQEAVLSTTLQENLSGVRVVKAFARQDFEMEKFNRDNWEKFVRGKKLLTIESLFWPITDILCAIQLLTSYYIGALMAMDGTISVGTYLAVSGMIVWIIFPMRNLGRIIIQISTGFVSFDRVMEIVKQSEEDLDEGEILPLERPEGKIEFKDVVFEYESGKNALDHVNFICQSGQSIALLGLTGSGKTTLVNLLPRFYDATSGTILLDDQDITLIPRRYLRQNIGIVEQEPFLFSMTIRNNITYGITREITEEEIYDAAKAAAIHDVILSFPKGYDTLVGERGVTLSGGQKQRVAIARTLLKNPSILILDDSTASVDLDTEAIIRDALQNLMQNRTTFIIAHRIQSIMNADQILIMENGKILHHGNHQKLLAESEIYQEIYQMQTELELQLSEEISNGS
ncbi:MAG: ABC transporter ATP-binding protein [Anaerolineaceae bacterium]|nr:ABC transporter ATP-binding protein [Anaerolineaceae bacterium]